MKPTKEENERMISYLKWLSTLNPEEKKEEYKKILKDKK